MQLEVRIPVMPTQTQRVGGDSVLHLEPINNKNAYKKEYSFPFITPIKCTILITTDTKEHLQHVSVHVYHLQGGKNASFKNQLPLENGAHVLKHAGYVPLKFVIKIVHLVGVMYCVPRGLTVCPAWQRPACKRFHVCAGDCPT
jgi:hypothetical protein